MTWTLGQEHYAKLRTVYHQLLLRTISFSRRQRSGHVLSYATALKQTQCDSVETVVRKRRLLFAGAVAKKHNGRLPRRVMFGALSGGEKPKPGRPEKMWLDCVSDNLKAFQATAALRKTPRQSSESRQRCGRRLPNGGTSGTTGSSKERSGSWRSGTDRKSRRGARATRKKWREAQGIGGGRGGSITTVAVLLQWKRVRSRWQIGSQGSKWTNFSWKVEVRVS